MMNNSEEKNAFFVMCQVTESSSEYLSQFPKKYERNQIATLVCQLRLAVFNDIIKRNLNNNNNKIIST